MQMTNQASNFESLIRRNMDDFLLFKNIVIQ